jgi:signal transduction histidine kinase
VLTEIPPGVFFVLGLAAAAPFLWLLWRRLGRRERALNDARRNLEIIRAAQEANDESQAATVIPPVPPALAEAAPAFEEEAAEPGRFQAFLDALPWPVWLRDHNYEMVYANRACLGEDMAGRTRGLAARAKEASQAMSESHLISVAGEARIFDIFEAPVAGWTGGVGYALDKSEREETESRLTLDAIDDMARDQVLEAINIAVAVYGPGKDLIFFNPAFVSLFGLNEAWLAGGPSMSEVLDRLREKRRLPEVADFPAYREQQLGRFGALKAAREELLHLPDGTTIREVAAPHSLGGLVFTFEDVTHGLRLERSLKTLTAVQGETLSNLYEGICVFGSDGRLRLFNPVFAGLWGLEADFLESGPHMSAVIEAMKPRLSRDSGAADSDWRQTRERFIQRLAGRVPSTGRIVRTDGQVLDYANVPLPDGAVMLSYLNVTDQAQVEYALRQRAEALEEAGRLKSEFIANVSHEVRTPINTIIGFADMLAGEHYGKLNPRQMEYGRGILETSKDLMILIDDILDLAAIEAGLMRLELDTVDLHVLLASVLGLVRERARRKALQLEFDCPPDIGWIVADEKRLKQVVFNLLSNAIEFTPERGTVSLKAARDKNGVVLTVRDSGIGIPKKEMRRIMEAFERGGEEPGRDGGSRRGGGLGLSLVKRFVELHDGVVSIKSRPGKGTSVVVRLPVEAARKVAEEPEQGSSASA